MQTDLNQKIFSTTQYLSIVVIPFSIAFKNSEITKRCAIYLWGLYYPLMFIKHIFYIAIRSFYNCLPWRIVWYICNMLYVVICKKVSFFLEKYAKILSFLICIAISMMAITCNKCVTIESAFSEFKQSPIEILNMHLRYCAYIYFSKLWKIKMSICQIPYRWVPFGLLLAGSNTKWVYKE